MDITILIYIRLRHILHQKKSYNTNCIPALEICLLPNSIPCVSQATLDILN